jgi:nucleoside-diphosphate-sugar epimerase
VAEVGVPKEYTVATLQISVLVPVTIPSYRCTHVVQSPGRFHPESSLLLTAAGLRKAATIFGADYPTPDGTCVRDFVHVSDLADAHLLALEYLRTGGESRALNVGLGEGYSVLEVIAEVERVTGRELPKQFSPRRPGDVPVLVADAGLARSVLGWTPTRRLSEMVSTAWKALQKVDRLLLPVLQQPAPVTELIPLNEEASRERIFRG